VADSSTKFTRETHLGRWEIIYEVRPPTTFTRVHKDGSTETVNVAPYIVKAVLLHLAQWDAPGSEVYQGVRHISHDTDLPAAGVKRALRVLRDAGLLKRTSRGWHETSLSVLDWEALEKLRVPFKSTFAASPKAPPEMSDDEREVLDDLGPAIRPAPEPEVEPAADLVTQVRALPGIGEKLTAKDATWVAASLAKELGEEGATQALSLLAAKPVALLRAASANKSTTGYLRTCAVGAFRDEVIDQAMNVADRIRTREIGYFDFGANEALARAFHAALLSSPAFAAEFEVQEVTQDDGGWSVPLSPRAAAENNEVSNG
jgi:hypothetical protein